jgi:hypothetical protein
MPSYKGNFNTWLPKKNKINLEDLILKIRKYSKIFLISLHKKSCSLRKVIQFMPKPPRYYGMYSLGRVQKTNEFELFTRSKETKRGSSKSLASILI